MQWFFNLSPVLQGFLATFFTYMLTAAGAGLVFFFRHLNMKILSTMMGFSAGIMLAAAFWSLLSPAIELIKTSGKEIYLVLSLSFLAGGLFVNLSDYFLAFVDKGKKIGKPTIRKSLLLTTAVTLHNIPEGLSIGIAFGSVALGLNDASFFSAFMLAVGIGIQNFPEGLCIAMPLRNEGYSRKKAFFIGQSSGIVEPIAGVLGVLAAMTMKSIMPMILVFSAGAMITVVCSEIIPDAFKENKILPTLGIMSGFCVMMVLNAVSG